MGYAGVDFDPDHDDLPTHFGKHAERDHSLQTKTPSETKPPIRAGRIVSGSLGITRFEQVTAMTAFLGYRETVRDHYRSVERMYGGNFDPRDLVDSADKDLLASMKQIMQTGLHPVNLVAFHVAATRYALDNGVKPGRARVFTQELEARTVDIAHNLLSRGKPWNYQP